MRNYLRLSQVLNKALIQLSRYNVLCFITLFLSLSSFNTFLVTHSSVSVTRSWACLYFITGKVTCQYFFMTFHKFLFDAVFCVSKCFQCIMQYCTKGLILGAFWRVFGRSGRVFLRESKQLWKRLCKLHKEFYDFMTIAQWNTLFVVHSAILWFYDFFTWHIEKSCSKLIL